MKYFSLFSGIGGFEYGIEQAHCSRNLWEPENTIWTSKTDIQSKRNFPNPISGDGDGRGICPSCIGFSEIDKYATQIYKKHFPTHKEYGNVTKIKWSNVPGFDLLVGGVPCQAWSIAGKRKGFEDSRGTMWYEFFRCLKEKQPSMFIAENVKGILSHNKGNSFEKICVCFCELGYVIDFEILNSKNFGVPQNRERVFIVGIKINLLDKCQVF